MHTALLFPGQGAQRPGFLGRLPPHAVVRATLAEAGATLGLDPAALDDATALRSTAAVQLSTVTAAVAVARALLAEGVAADAVAGLSVGAFAAAVICGALSFADALQLVRLRAECMARAAPAGYGMSAIVGLTERAARGLVARVAARRPLYLASVNAPSEVVVSGDEAALALAAAEAQAVGAATQRLQVSIPSHCPLMEPVSARLRTALAGVPLARPRLPYVSNHRARLAREARDVAEDLVLNVSRTVRWLDSVTLLHELGCRTYIETPPGKVLSNLLRASLSEVCAVPLEEVPLATARRMAQRVRRR